MLQLEACLPRVSYCVWHVGYIFKSKPCHVKASLRHIIVSSVACTHLKQSSITGFLPGGLLCPSCLWQDLSSTWDLHCLGSLTFRPLGAALRMCCWHHVPGYLRVLSLLEHARLNPSPLLQKSSNGIFKRLVPLVLVLARLLSLQSLLTTGKALCT